MSRPLNPQKALCAALDQSRTRAALFDADRRLIYLNPAMAEWLGAEPASLIGQTAPYSSTVEANSLLAGIMPPPTAFAGKMVTGTISQETHRTDDSAQLSLSKTLFLPLDTSDGRFAVLLLAAESNDAVAAESEARDQAWHSTLQRLRLERRDELRHAYLLGEHPAMQRVREQLALARATSTSLTIIAPPGTGIETMVNELLAHRTTANGSMMIDCPVHDLTSFSAMLSSRPAGVSLWLKEVPTLSLEMQAKVIALLRSGVIAKVVATSSRSLANLVRQKKWSAELAALLSTLTIRIPPLRLRVADLPLLAQWCVEQQNATQERQLSGVLPATLERLAAYTWPGNVDEFVAVMSAACAKAKGLWVTPDDLPERLHAAWDELVHPRRAPQPIQLDQLLADVEKQVLQQMLQQTRGNKAKAAQRLGISRPRLLRRLVQLGLLEEEKIDFQPLDDGEGS